MNPGPLAEFTFKAVAAGVVLGVVFGAANAYLGLRVGMTVSASIPAAVMTVALFCHLAGAVAGCRQAVVVGGHPHMRDVPRHNAVERGRTASGECFR